MAILEFVLHKNSNINLGNNRRRAKIALSLSLSQKIIALLLSYAVVYVIEAVYMSLHFCFKLPEMSFISVCETVMSCSFRLV